MEVQPNSKNEHVFSMVNINVQAYQSKRNKLELALLNRGFADVICITEHWLTDQKLRFCGFPNYRLLTAYCREKHTGGGVMILGKQDIAAMEINLRKYAEEKNIEACGIEIKSLNMVVVGVYRSPSGNEEVFIQNINRLIEKLQETFVRHKFFIIGDFNINILTKSRLKETFLEVMDENGLQPVFDEPSRETETTTSCIDNMFTNIPKTCYQKETINLHISDHLTQVLRLTKVSNTTKTKITYRNMNKHNIKNFQEMLRQQEWKSIYKQEKTANQSYEDFHANFQYNFNIAFPECTTFKTRKQNQKHPPNKYIQKLKNTLDAIYTIIKVTNENSHWNMYRKLKEEFTKSANQAKLEINSMYILRSENKQKAAWNIVNEELGRKKNTVPETSLKPDDFNKYFVEVACGQQQQLGLQGNHPHSLALIPKFNNSKSMFMSFTSPEEIISIIRNLKNKSTRDIYEISTKLLKGIAECISQPLSYTLNKCIEEGVFPESLKRGKVTPVFKKGEAEQASNYRPITILPTISKIFETVIKDRLLNFFGKHGYVSDAQHGYIKHKSTTTALIKMIDHITEAFDKKEYSQVTMLDLSKAFDMVDHRVLLGKLSRYGVRGNCYKILKEYLKNRWQIVDFNGQRSNWTKTGQGVPQGSILGPVLFVIYMNDLPLNLDAGIVNIFADDTSFVNTDPDLQNLQTKTLLSQKMAEEWFQANNLKMNKEKTDSIIIYTKKTDSIEKRNVKFLGVTISETLGWSAHIDELSKKLSNAIYCLKTLKKIVTSEVLRSTYFAMFHGTATYALAVWGASPEIHRIFLKQKKAVRILHGVKQDTSCRELFRTSEILTIHSAYILACILLISKNLHNQKKHESFHSFDTRNKSDLSLPYHRVAKSQCRANYLGLKLYNKLPREIKEDHGNMKKNVRRILLKGAYYGIGEFLEGTLAE